MRIALIGAGRMGSAVTRLAGDRNHELAAIFSSRKTVSDTGARDALAAADVAIDFSVPDAVETNVAVAVDAGVPIVVGTTGWHSRLESVNALVESGGGALLHAPNFSLGVALLSVAVRSITPLINRLEEFDVYVTETHHVRKIDSPSGTALHLARILLDGIERKTSLRTQAPDGQILPDELQVLSSRAGFVFGVHNIDVDGPDDHLTLTHAAKSRDGFARGALVAAEWIVGRKGVFTLDDLLLEWTLQENEALTESIN